MRTLHTEPYLAQHSRWPTSGRHVLAQADAETVVVYQAFDPSIAAAAAEADCFCGSGFALDRTTWIKPSFLWMMYRSAWATNDGQQAVLAIWLDRSAFDTILGSADVRARWEADHAPNGEPVERDAVELGLSGPVLSQFACPWIKEIQDITPLVRTMHEQLERGGLDALVCPREQIYG